MEEIISEILTTGV